MKTRHPGDTLLDCHCAVGVAVRAAAALIVAPPDTNVNTSPPDSEIGWENVGQRGIGDGVYLGKRWVITAYHVGAGTTAFSVGTFSYLDGSAVRLQNPDGTNTDLLMYRLTDDPGLPELSIATSTPAVHAEVTFIGDGRAIQPGDTESYWTVTQIEPDPDSNPEPNYTWTPVGSGDPYNASGYVATTSGKLWGTNLVERDSDFFEDEEDADHTVLVDDHVGLNISFFTAFDKQGDPDGNATDHEAQAESHDSGSAAFAREDDEWVLAGVTYAIGVFNDQPDIGATAVYGNFTFAADLAQYHDQILWIMNIPEPSGFWLVGGIGLMVGLLRLGFRRFR